MHGAHGEAAHEVATAIFGWDPMIVAATILAIAYAFIISEKLNRAVVALLGAGALILTGVLNQHLAVQGIDFNTIFLLTGMMIIVAITKRSGIFQYVAIVSAKTVRGDPRMLLLVLALITAVFSALLDNVTTVLLIVPITLLLTDQLKLQAYPFLFTQIFASNIGGTATLIGDPPNILIGSAEGFSFMDFVINVGPAALVNLILLLIFADFFWGRKFQTSLKARAHLMRYDEKKALTDVPLLIKSMITLALVLSGFIFGHGHGLEPGSIAMTGAGLLMLLDIFKEDAEHQTHKVEEFLGEVEWETIFFFMGLFILVFGVEHTGLLRLLANEMITLTGGDMTVSGMVILWTSAIVSAIVDNIPFVATMIPMMQSMAVDMGGEQAIRPLWWALSLGACLGGNGSLIGASANVMVASFAARAGQRISFLGFMKLAFPLMLVTIAVSMVYLLLVFFS